MTTEQYIEKYFYDEEDVVLTYLYQGTLQDKLNFVGIPASDIRGSIDNVVEDTIVNMPEDEFHDYAVKYCEELMEKGIKGRKYKDIEESVSYEGDVVDRLARCISKDILKYEQDDSFFENSTFDFEHYSVQLPFEALTEKQELFIDPKNKFFTGEEYNDLYLNINNSGLQPRMSVQLCTDGDFKKEFFFSPNQMESIHSSFMYTVEAYDKDRDEYHLCGLTNDIKTAEQIANYAFEAEEDRTDTDRDVRHVPDIDCISVSETKSNRIIGMIYDNNGYQKTDKQTDIER